MKVSSLSVGQAIRRIRAKEFSQVYAIYGGEYYFEDYLIKEISKTYFSDDVIKKYFYLDLDSEEELFRELSAISLFEEKSLIIVREIKKMLSQKSRKELLNYIHSPNKNIILLILENDYDMKNSFLKNIADNSQFIDSRTPFISKMKEWVSSYVKSKNIKISDKVIDYYIENYGDTLSNVISEIEQASILLGDNEITELNIDKINITNRNYNLWNFQDSIGNKNIDKSLKIGKSLLENGVKTPQIIVSLVYMFHQMLWKKMSNYKPIGFTGINKIISSNISKYNKIYSKEELDTIINELSKLDILSKTTSLNDFALIEILIVKICKK